ncbi:MAG: BadF/BadG/BcrA/BcrD ATPase family protein, partial [Candidatus Hydromicrobium sp.]
AVKNICMDISSKSGMKLDTSKFKEVINLSNEFRKWAIKVNNLRKTLISYPPYYNGLNFILPFHGLAGTSRFLEVMARAMEINIEQFAPIFIKTNDKVDITSTCTVFAESEIVSLIGQGVDKNKIIKGLIYSIADKITSMVVRVGLDEPVCMTGGVAKNLGVVKALEENLGIKIIIPDEPQITGALGAACLAQNLH